MYAKIRIILDSKVIRAAFVAMVERRTKTDLVAVPEPPSPTTINRSTRHQLVLLRLFFVVANSKRNPHSMCCTYCKISALVLKHPPTKVPAQSYTLLITPTPHLSTSRQRQFIHTHPFKPGIYQHLGPHAVSANQFDTSVGHFRTGVARHVGDVECSEHEKLESSFRKSSGVAFHD